MLPEDSYGRRKRFDFVAQCVRDSAASTILDFGCGTGVHLTRPLALHFPRVHVIGVDSDADSIAHAAAQPNPENLRFASPESISPGDRFDLVIASEVLEHVEDPPAFLDRLTTLMAPQGRMIVTIPNGYGPFEAMALIEVLLNLSGIQAVLRRMKHRLAGHLIQNNVMPAGDSAPTLAISPHVNFFTRGALQGLFTSSGLVIHRFQPTTFLCGYLIDSLIVTPRAISWNAQAANRLPAWCVSDWMFELSRGEPGNVTPWRRNAWSRFRWRLNERRWRLR